MALSANTVWEVRSSGADTNGGGFVTGASGTDWSQQDAAQYSVTDAVTNGTTTITSATANFGTDVVGNILYIQGGTAPITAGWYQITARTNSTTITVDRSTGLTAGTGATLKIGGALLTLSKAFAVWTTSNTVYVKNGSYSIATGLNAGSVNILPNSIPNRVIGYDATRDDYPTGSARPTFTASAAIDMLSTDANMEVSGIILDANSTANRCFYVVNGNPERGPRFVNCKALNFKVSGFQNTAGGGVHIACEATGGNSGATGAFYNTAYHFACYAHDNICHGFRNPQVCIGCIADTNTGASTDGFNFDDNALSGCLVLNCVAYNNGRSGLRNHGTYQAVSIFGSIFSQNTAYGISAGLAFRAHLTINYNAFYSNTSGPRNNYTAGPNDVTLTGDPFTNAAAGDFSLNNTAGAGAACRAAGFPGVFPGGLTTGYLDIGAVQHQDAGGGGGRSHILSGGAL
jgi:hypothetical protein